MVPYNPRMFTYFDNNATTALDSRVLEAMLPYMAEMAGNPSSLHSHGRRVRSAIDLAREQIAALVNAHPSQIVFTSGGSEANNLALKGAIHSKSIQEVWFSAVEHDSIRQTVATLKSSLREVVQLPVDENGLIQLDFLNKQQSSTGLLASTLWVNNESGVIQDISRLNQIIKKQNGLHHVDAVQALGKIAIDFKESNIDLMTVSSHKIFGPQGVGALIVKTNFLTPLICGGGQENGMRSGTENVAGIVGFGRAAELAKEEMLLRQTKSLALRVQLEQELKKIEGVVILSESSPRVSNTCFFSVPRINGEMLLMELDRRGFCVSSGSACRSRAGKPSHVLEAMCIPEALAECVIRVSLSHLNEPIEITRFIKALQEILSF